MASQSPALALLVAALAHASLLASCDRRGGPSPDASADPSHLPQTREMPTATGSTFDARVRGLWRGIVEDDPDEALPFFFPLAAYEQVKDIADPAADWQRRLGSAYVEDVHALHRWLGADAPRAKLVALEVKPESVRWVEPGEEANRIGYYRVIGATLRFDVDGTTRAANVQTLISWRGEWYVVHLRKPRP